MPCYRCGRAQADPPKGGPSPWARAVVSGEQVLVCPDCQQSHPAWSSEAERCPACGQVAVSIQIGLRVCRRCGHHWDDAG